MQLSGENTAFFILAEKLASSFLCFHTKNGSSSNLVVNSLFLYFQVDNCPFCLL
ncbi:hypothetical protein M075_4599 [Bacteroides fragilis str. 20793-3]|nr:hypothetical protein M085_4030 [Bacteroides fragilis str. 3986 N(B)19]EYA36941.1 hypothetical protein M075_4599 [Bacteroides fragilis str. 20793-3]